MKLHLPKTLLVAVLTACVAPAWAFGPTEVVDGETQSISYTEVNKATGTTAVTPTEDTYYSNVTGAFDITAGEGVDVKLGQSSNDGDEVNLGTISAASTWLAKGRFLADANSDLSGAGNLYINSGALQIKNSLTITNNITLGASTYGQTGWSSYPLLNSAALIIGTHSSNEEQTVTLGGTLTIAETAKVVVEDGYKLNISGALSGSQNLTFATPEVNGKKSTLVTLSGSVVDYSGSIETKSDDESPLTLKLTGNATGLLSNSSTTITVGAYTKLDLSAVDNLTFTDTLASKITNNGSIIIDEAITVNTATSIGTLEIVSLDGFEATDIEEYTGGSNAANGFTQVNVKTIVDGSSTLNGISVKHLGYSGTTDENGWVILTDTRTFYVNTGTEAVSAAKNNGTAVTSTIEMANGTTLTVDADFATVRTVEGATAATLTVDNTTDTNPTITTLSAAGAEVTINGTSGLSITNATAETVTANADINLGANAHAVNNLVINDGATVTTTYGNDGGNVVGFVKDRITINGGGTLKHTGSVNSPFGAGNNGINSITLGGTSGKTATLLFNRRTAISSCSLTLNGYSTIGSVAITGAVQATETSGRDNSAVLDFIGSNKVTVSGTNNTINAALRLRDGKTTFEVNNTVKDGVTSEGSVVINGNVFNSDSCTFTKSGEGKLTIASASAVVHKVDVTAGTLEIAEGKQLQTVNATKDNVLYNGDMSISSGATLALNSENAFDVAGTLTFADGAKLGCTLEAIEVAENGNNLSFTLGTAGSFIGVDTLMYAGEMEGYTAKFSTVAGDNNKQSLVLTFEQNAITLTETQVTEVLGFEAGVLTLKTDVAANKYVFGDTFNVNISAELWETVIAKVAPEANEFSITMQDAAGTLIDFGTATPTVVFNGQTGTVLPGATTTAGIYSVPEPTTATLSLLALAALAARRRRK